MKKLLLTTAAAALLASTANAELTITVGGHADFQVGFSDQAEQFEQDTVFSRNYHTRNDTELFFNVDGETDSGLKYGAYIELEADVSGDDSTGGALNNAERTSIYLEYKNLGRVEMGATGDAADRLRVDASKFNSETLASATGGIRGDFNKYVVLTNNATIPSSEYYILPGLPTAVGRPGDAASDGFTQVPFNELRATANKISYYSPRVAGLQLGVSFTPNQFERGTGSKFIGDSFGIENVFNAGLNYEQDYDIDGAPLTIAASLTGEMGDAVDNARDDLKAYAAGLSASYLGFTLGGSYGLLDELNSTSTWNSEGTYWTAGAAYEFGPFSTSVSYLASELDNVNLAGNDSEFTNLSVGADYKLAPGLMPYVEVSFFDASDDNAATIDNDGTIVIVGTQLTF